MSHFTLNDSNNTKQLIFIDPTDCSRFDSVPFPIPIGMEDSEISLALSADSIFIVGDIFGRIAIYQAKNKTFDLIFSPFQFAKFDASRRLEAYEFGPDSWLYYGRWDDIYRYHFVLDIHQKLNATMGLTGNVDGMTFHKDTLYFLENSLVLEEPWKIYEVDPITYQPQLVHSNILHIRDSSDVLQVSTNISSIQFHCEDVKMLVWGIKNRYYEVDFENNSMIEYCTDLWHEKNGSQGEGLTWGYPQWSDCKLSIDLNLDDELYQFKRDYDRIPCGHTDLSLSDDDVQVFASGGVIDSIVVELLNPVADQYIVGTANGNIQIVGDGTAHVKLIANANADFDDYEDVIRSLRYIDDNPFTVSTREITFTAYHKGVPGIVATSTLDIQSETPYAGRDTIIELCAENTLLHLNEFIDQDISYSGQWTEGDGFLDISNALDTVFYYEVSALGCRPDTAAFYVHIDKEVLYESVDTSLCAGESITLSGIEYNSTQTVVLEESSEDCDSIYSTYNLYFEPFEQFVVDTVLCEGEVILFDNLEIDTAGEYEFTLRSISGCDSLEYNITVEQDLPMLEPDILVQEFTINENEPTEVEINLPEGFEVISWYPQTGLDCGQCQLVEVQLSQDQKYQVEISNVYGCPHYLEVCIEVIPTIDFDYYIPNIFDPNDPANATFGVFTGFEDSVEYDMQIYDRWGNLIFEATELNSSDRDSGWNGSASNGQKLEQGVYVYRIVVQGRYDKTVVGDILKL